MSLDDPKLQVEITIDPSRGRHGGQCRRARSKVPDLPRIPRITRLMALAVKFQDMVDRGEVRDYAELALLGYVSRARLTQIMNLLLLAPEIQEELLNSTGSCEIRESKLRQVVRHELWQEQLEVMDRRNQK